MTILGSRRWLAIGGALASLVACAAQTTDNREVVDPRPDRETFPFVADLLVHRCGTLDCHGKVGRNLRLYGHEGLRLAGTDYPTAEPTTTVAEYDEDYLSIVTLEPEKMQAVIAEQGASPDRLTLVRKARGSEHHKAGTIWSTSDKSDLCLTSWLAGHTDTAACLEGTAYKPTAK